MTRAEQEAYQDRCRQALEIALGEVRLYQRWRTADPGPSHDIDARFRALPVLTKDDIRAHFPHGLVPRGLDPPPQGEQQVRQLAPVVHVEVGDGDVRHGVPRNRQCCRPVQAARAAVEQEPQRARFDPVRRRHAPGRRCDGPRAQHGDREGHGFGPRKTIRLKKTPSGVPSFAR